MKGLALAAVRLAQCSCTVTLRAWEMLPKSQQSEQHGWRVWHHKQDQAEQAHLPPGGLRGKESHKFFAKTAGYHIG